jgi:CreA protein
MAIKGIHLSWITVSDIQKAKKFYHEMLGLPIQEDAPAYNWFEVAPTATGTRLGIGQEHPDYQNEKAGTNAVVTFTVDNIIEEKQRLEKLGVTFEGDIMEIPHQVKLATFFDFDGNKFQLAQVLRA